jgi:hypothetical protein
MATQRQVLANRQNGLKGGVKTEEGKLISRLNARKHGIFASALTTEDSEDLYGIEDELIASLRPVGRVEEMLVEKLALTYLRMQRCARAEAEYHVQTWEEPNKIREPYQWEHLQQQRRDGARGSPFKERMFERMVKLIDLYDARLTNQFLKLIHEIERQQQNRGESSSRAVEHGNGTTPQAASADDAPSPAATQTSCPPSEPLSFVPPVAQPPSTVLNCVPALSQAMAPVPHTPEKSQVVDAKEADAPMTI